MRIPDRSSTTDEQRRLRGLRLSMVVAIFVMGLVMLPGCGRQKDVADTPGSTTTTSTTLAIPAAIDSAQSSADAIAQRLDEADQATKAAQDAASAPAENN